MRIVKQTKTELLQELAERYRQSGQEWPATARQIAAWVIGEGLWKPQPKSIVGQCAAEIAAAMRQEFFTDPQGRRVRKKHVFRDGKTLLDGTWEQLGFRWLNIDDATEDQAMLIFQYERRMVIGDCRQLKTDVDSYNDNNKHNAYIEICFDFGDDLAELEQEAVYPGL